MGLKSVILDWTLLTGGSEAVMQEKSWHRLRRTSPADPHPVEPATAPVCMSADQPSTAVSAPCHTHTHTMNINERPCQHHMHIMNMNEMD